MAWISGPPVGAIVIGSFMVVSTPLWRDTGTERSFHPRTSHACAWSLVVTLGVRIAGELSPPFVGRHAEADRLMAAWREASASGDLRVVLVGGEPGIGKTRLVDEVTTVIAEDRGDP